jgi:hypothetical protein
MFKVSVRYLASPFMRTGLETALATVIRYALGGGQGQRVWLKVSAKKKGPGSPRPESVAKDDTRPLGI